MDHFDDIGPSVVMASPGMIQNGLSRELFESWCTDKRNGVIIAGYCVEGTLAKVSHRVGVQSVLLECWSKSRQVLRHGFRVILCRLLPVELPQAFLLKNTKFRRFSDDGCTACDLDIFLRYEGLFLARMRTL